MTISYARALKLLVTTVTVTSSEPDWSIATLRVPELSDSESDPTELPPLSTATVTMVTSLATHVYSRLMLVARWLTVIEYEN